LIQFEDFLTPNAYGLLRRYRDRVLCFNDDIQGTAAVALAGVYASTRISGRRFRDLRIMFLGAGSAATGIADLIVAALVNEGVDRADARRRLSFVDQYGLLVKGRTDLMEHNRPYALDGKPLGFLEAIDALAPDALIGATGAPGTFTRDVVERMCRLTSAARSSRAAAPSGRSPSAGARSAPRRRTTPTCFPASGSARSPAARVDCPTNCS
jgi:malate dehydrogenase (oxaloacetate-decarboxylating)(NADP+)